MTHVPSIGVPKEEKGKNVRPSDDYRTDGTLRGKLGVCEVKV
jgi:hypothetical protein